MVLMRGGNHRWRWSGRSPFERPYSAAQALYFARRAPPSTPLLFPPFPRSATPFSHYAVWPRVNNKEDSVMQRLRQEAKDKTDGPG